jgi:hypothetical protein
MDIPVPNSLANPLKLRPLQPEAPPQETGLFNWKLYYKNLLKYTE